MAILPRISTAFENAVYECLHFQRHAGVENAGTPMCRGNANESAFPELCIIWCASTAAGRWIPRVPVAPRYGYRPLDEIDRHIADHQVTIETLRGEAPIIAELSRAVNRCADNGGCVFWLGNGGSAADCQHLAAEMVGRFERERAGIASIALTTDTSALTAIGNDYGFERIFARQVQALCRAGDLVIGISTSGNSPNVVAALEAATAMGIETAALSGRNGGQLRHIANVCLTVRSDNTARIQEAHILVGHILCDLAERHIAGAGAARAQSGGDVY